MLVNKRICQKDYFTFLKLLLFSEVKRYMIGLTVNPKPLQQLECYGFGEY